MEVMELSFEKQHRMNDQSYLTVTKFLKFHYEGSSGMQKGMADIERRGCTLNTEWVEGAVDMYETILEALHNIYRNLSNEGDEFTLTTLPNFHNPDGTLNIELHRVSSIDH